MEGTPAAPPVSGGRETGESRPECSGEITLLGSSLPEDRDDEHLGKPLVALIGLPSFVVPMKGEDTTIGQAGYCPRCDQMMDHGPDLCIGLLPGVSHACCGHGCDYRAYVTLGGEPNQDATTISHPEVLRGEAALAYFGLSPSTREQRLRTAQHLAILDLVRLFHVPAELILEHLG